MVSIKIPLLLILLLCTAVPAFGTDTVHTYDTVVHYDTTYLYDTTVAVQRQLSEMKSEFYDKAIQSLDDKRSSVNTMLTIIAIFLGIMTIVFGFMTYLMHRSRREVDNEIKEIRQRRLTIDRVYDEIMSREKRFRQAMTEIEERAAKIVAAAEKQAHEKSITSPEEKIKLIEKADAERSIDEYEKLLFAMELEGIPKEKLPTSLHKNVGINYYRLKRYEKAVEEFLLYLAAFADDEECLFSIAYCFGELKNHDRAVHFYSRVTQLNPKHDIAYVNWACDLGNLYDERKDVSLLEEAIAKCKKATEINDKNDSAYYNWGLASAKLYDESKDECLLEEAIEKFKKGVEINEKNDSAYAGWGTTLSKLYDERKDVSLLEEAIAKYSKAIEINSKNDDAYVDWGVVLSKLYDERKDDSLLDEAIEKFKKANEINDKNTLAHYNLAEVLLKKWRRKLDDTGKSDETLLIDARGHALEALVIAPEQKDYNYNLACAESLSENRPEMLKALKIAIEYDPKLKKMAREDKDKDFEKYWDDPDFIALTKEDQ